MPSKYKRRLGSRKYRDFSEETLQEALEDIRTNKLAYRVAADKYGIPKSTLERKFNQKNMKSWGGQTNLSEEENILVQAIITASEWGFPLEKEDIKDLVHGYGMRQGKNIKKFRDGRPGDSWYYGFIARHNNLSIRLSENIKRSRAAVSVEMLNEYFDNLSTSLKDVPPQNILNYDESGFTDDPGRNKVVVRKKSKHAERVIDFSKSNTSVMFCVSGLAKPCPRISFIKRTISGAPGLKEGHQMLGTIVVNRVGSIWHSLKIGFLQQLYPILKNWMGLKYYWAITLLVTFLLKFWRNVKITKFDSPYCHRTVPTLLNPLT